MKIKKTHIHQELAFEMKGNTLFISKSLHIGNVMQLVDEVEEIIEQKKSSEIVFDLSNLENIDSAGVVTLSHLQEKAKENNITTRVEGANDSITQKLKLFKPRSEEEKPKPREESYLFQIGDILMRFIYHDVVQFAFYVADVLYWSVTDLFKQKQQRKGETVNQAINIGVNAVPIVMGLTFIIGVVLALQSAKQLVNFGANIFIVDLIVLAITAEMGPILTAILVAGRSGSSIAAEIATMKVTNEIDALRTMALNPLRFLVVPKIYGALITMPFLVILANVAGIVGGATAAFMYLDLTPEIFIARMPDALYQKDIITGLIKSVVYALIIVITGSYLGFQAERGAEGVGKVTTQSVVVSITLVIVADMILGLLFY